MCINQILKNEQIELMLYASATVSEDMNIHMRRLSRFEHQLEAHPYPHRPYVSRQMSGPTRPSFLAPPTSNNEGGTC